MTQTEEKTDLDLNEVTRKNRRGRMYIPHGRGEEKPYRPHTQHIDVAYSECGPDYSSMIRWLPSPNSGERPRETTFYPPLLSLRHFPKKANVKTTHEYTFYPPHGIPLVYSNGKVTLFRGIHKASQRTYNELTDITRFGRKGFVFDHRDGYPAASQGDKAYKIPEYSPNFHKVGSTRPVVNFGGFKAEAADTFIPLQPLPPIPVKPFTILEAERRKNEEIDEVRSLEQWRPASPLVVPTTDWR